MRLDLVVMEFEYPYVIVISVIIAVASTCVALALFFRFQKKWKANLYVQVACGVIIALAVCVMHYTGIASHQSCIRQRFQLCYCLILLGMLRRGIVR